MPLVVLGVAIEALGLLFALQGLGVVRWPASSFMIDQMLWLYVGIAMVAVGNLLIFVGFRRRRR